MKARQFCSVCKQWLDMEVVPTGDGDEDDGVIWFRCPRCQGFLPTVGGGAASAHAAADDEAPSPAAAAADSDSDLDTEDDLPWDSPAAMMAARALDAGVLPDDVLLGEDVVLADEDDDEADDLVADVAQAPAAVPTAKPDAAPAEPIAEYAAMLAAADPSAAVPYRASESYAVGQCVHHLAWDDCGVVVAKEPLPGGRRIIKCYFGSAGVVRLIEKAPA